MTAVNDKELPALKKETLDLSNAQQAAMVKDKASGQNTVPVDVYYAEAAKFDASLTGPTIESLNKFNTLYFAAGAHAAGAVSEAAAKDGGADATVTTFDLGSKNSWLVNWNKTKQVSGGVPKAGEETPPKQTAYGSFTGKLEVHGTGKHSGEMSVVAKHLAQSAQALFA